MNDLHIFFRNEISDLEAYYDFYLQTPEGKKYGRTLLLWQQGFVIFICLLVCLIFFLLGSPLDEVIGFGAFIFLLVQFILLWVSNLKPADYLARRAMRSLVKRWDERKRGFFLAPKECHITPENIIIRSEVSEHRWKWEAIDRLTRVDDFLFLELGSFFYVIPRRDFETPQAFEQFAQAIQDFYQATRQAPVPVEIKVQSLKRLSSERSKTLARLLLLVAFICICIGFAAGMDFLFSQKTLPLPQGDQIQTVLEDYLRAMQNRDVEKALSYFYTPNETNRLFLQEQTQGINYALYAGYQGLEITSWSLNYDTQRGNATISAVITYRSNFTGLVSADLETKDGAWKIQTIRVYASPQEIKRFLESSD